MIFILHKKVNKHKNQKWFSGHYSRVAETAGNSPLHNNLQFLSVDLIMYKLAAGKEKV